MKIMRNIVARVFIYFIFVLISLVALGGVASAAGPSNGTYLKDVNDVQVPQWVTAPDPNNPVFSGRCTDSNGTNWSAGQSAWISTQSGAWFTEQSVTVAAGTTSVPLNVVFANTWCTSSRYNALGTYNLIESVSATKGATVSGIAANTVIAAGQPSQPFSLGWTAVAVAALPFNLNLPANLSPGRHDIVVTLNSGKKINSAQDTQKNTYYYQCVKNSNPSVYPRGVAPSDFAPCLTGPAELVVTINVPQPNYLGQIQTLKYDTTTGVLATDQDMKNARTYIEPCGGSATCSNVGSNNWLTGVYMWVYQNGPGYGNGVQNIHSSKIEVPTGYRVNNARLNLNTSPVTNVTPTTTADGKLTCDGSNNTGTCSIGTKVWNNNTTFVDWFLEKIPQPIEYYPWLQTKNGDVTSANNSIGNGKITGQKIGSATDSNFRRGARRAGTGTIAATVAESSFVVAATDAAGFGYFCSQERFVLGKSLADRDNFDDGSCKTGGYAPSPVNFDKVRASVSKAYADNGNGVLVPAPGNRCAPKYATSAVATAASLNTTLGLGCPTGGIQKIGVQADTVTLSSELTVNGRGTLWIPGKLVINNDIKYSTTNYTNDPKTTPNLVIFVEGNVMIGAGVIRIDAAIISKGTISTCKDSGTPGPACSSDLVINGFLASGGKIDFARRFYNQATLSPAELINLTSQSTTFPAPGLDRTDTDVTSKLQINSGELAPRLR